MSEFKGTKGKWTFEVEQDADFKRLVIVDEEGNWIFNSEQRTWIDIEEESNFLVASKSKEILEMLQIILNCHRKNIPLKNYDLNNIEQLIKQSTEL